MELSLVLQLLEDRLAQGDGLGGSKERILAAILDFWSRESRLEKRQKGTVSSAVYQPCRLSPSRAAVAMGPSTSM